MKPKDVVYRIVFGEGKQAEYFLEKDRYIERRRELIRQGEMIHIASPILYKQAPKGTVVE